MNLLQYYNDGSNVKTFSMVTLFDIKHTVFPDEISMVMINC